MKRNHAIQTVLDYFEQQDYVSSEMTEALTLLKRYLKTNRTWNDENIREAIEGFIEKNGRPPKVKELDLVDGLPPHTAITNLYKMPTGQWLLENYPPSFEISWRYLYSSDAYSRDDYISYFVDEFTKVNPTSAVDFNARRNQNKPSWQYVAKQLGLTKWTELKELCGVEYIPPVKQFKVSSVITNLM